MLIPCPSWYSVFKLALFTEYILAFGFLKLFDKGAVKILWNIPIL